MLQRPWVRYTLCVVVALALGVAVGRATLPAKVVTKTETRTEVRYQDRIVYREAKTRVVYRDVVRTVTVAPDGTRTTTTADHSTDRVNTTTTADAHAETDSRVETSTLRVVTAKPSWRVAAMLGATLRGPGGLVTVPGAVNLAPAPLGPALVGVEGSARIAGPFSAGGWILTNGRDVLGGASLGVEF